MERVSRRILISETLHHAQPVIHSHRNNSVLLGCWMIPLTIWRCLLTDHWQRTDLSPDLSTFLKASVHHISLNLSLNRKSRSKMVNTRVAVAWIIMECAWMNRSNSGWYVWQRSRTYKLRINYWTLFIIKCHFWGWEGFCYFKAKPFFLINEWPVEYWQKWLFYCDKVSNYVLKWTPGSLY